MTDQPTGDPTDRLTYQQIDALWGAVAIPGPTAPTFPMQHERVCRAVAEIIDEMTPAVPAVPVSSPPPDHTALREAIDGALHHVLNSDLGKGAWTRLRAKATDAVLAVLPPPADWAAVLLWAADGFDRHAEQILDGVGNKAVFVAKALRDQAAVWREAAETLRRLAAEAEQPDTETATSSRTGPLGPTRARTASAGTPRASLERTRPRAR